jgi:uncharacterized membrane protein YciS (DUF1049 family)
MGNLTESEYDISTAVTFLLAGLGIGSLVTILLFPRSESRVTGIHRVASSFKPANTELRRAL